MVKLTDDTMDGDTTTMMGNTTNGEVPPCWSLDGNPNDKDEQSQLAMLSSFFNVSMYLPRGGQTPPGIYINFTHTMNL